jgi:hypothetical protein
MSILRESRKNVSYNKNGFAKRSSFVKKLPSAAPENTILLPEKWGVHPILLRDEF